MSERSKKFLSYYRPYLKLFLADMFCAMIAAGITLVFPMIIRYITGTVLIADNFEMGIIYKLGIFMVVLVIVEYLCNYFVAYQGHVMGVYMERDLRNELFQHYIGIWIYDRGQPEAAQKDSAEQDADLWS